MQVAQLACIIRFDAFQSVPEDSKYRLIRRLLEMDVGHPEFQRIIQPFLQFQQFTKLEQFVKKRSLFYKPLRLDLDLIANLFWSEEIPAIAYHLLGALLQVSPFLHESMWNTATNVWMSARTIKEKQAALTLLNSMHFSHESLHD